MSTSAFGWRQIAAAALAIVLAAVAAPASPRGSAGEPALTQTIAASHLPAEARETLKLIRQGGPFPYARDGAVFGNFEKLLPRREKGYYREYTVATPGLRHRGARRIVAGRGGELYYTEDHYASFRRIRE